MIIVSNTSPITSLSAIGQIHLLHEIYGNIIIPKAVYEEMTGLGYTVPGTIEVQTLAWIETKELENRLLLEQFPTKLHRGESETIALAIALNADRVIMDENPGRKHAISLGLNVVGVLGILLIAQRRNLINSIKPAMDDLINKAGFRINKRLYLEVLKAAQESE
ncbi:MAG: DUF3368 domain-containing protein [Nostocales cyanobacterium]|nr:MAG: DUF3368 domain-containing protein [Nostocales cyanobacterium]TAF12511.1 MAG: DUF3368 domain-containing protein [Nostocales cyanobacterium]